MKEKENSGDMKNKESGWFLEAIKRSRERQPVGRPATHGDKSKYDRKRSKKELRKEQGEIER